MSAHPYVLLATYPGSGQVHLIKAGDKHVAATEENLPVLRLLAQGLLAENIIATAQIYRACSEVMVAE